MVVFGITGGSGAGKGAVSDIFRSLGVYVIDADAVGHEVTATGSDCLNELAERFGNQIINADGTLNRRILGDIVFSDDTELTALNSITHKFIKHAIIERLDKCGTDFAAIDGAVIIGSDVQPLCEFIISVIADRETRIERIIERDGITREKAEARLAAQPNDKFYIENSRYIIENNRGKDSLQEKVYNVYKEITGK